MNPGARAAMIIHHIVASTLCLLAGAVPLLAQDAEEGDSATFVPAGRPNSLRVQMDLSWANVWSARCGGCAEPHSEAAAGHLALGWPIGRRVVVGWEIGRVWRNGWYVVATPDNPPQVDLRGAWVAYYPPGLGHLSVQASVGRARYRFVGGYTPEYEYGRRVTLKGDAFGVGLAYDAWPWPGASMGLAPFARWSWVPNGRGTRLTPNPGASVRLRQSFSVRLGGAAVVVR
jgi:hypothetical protein